MIICKTKGEIELMRQAGRVVALAIEGTSKHIKPGITTLELDEIAADIIRSHDCIPTFNGQYGFPRNICISVNEEVVHGIPSSRKLKEGDLVKLDVGATYKGWVGDSAATFPVGKVSAEAQKLMDVTKEAMLLGIDQMRVGHYLNDIAEAIHSHIEKFGFSTVADYGGHGIGRKNHEDPFVPQSRQKTRGMQLRKGMCLAVEPMINLGTAKVEVKGDKWTVVTSDGKLSSHFEHSAAITDGDPIILTLK
jgi:methionyl aminopeptidase